MTFGGIGGGFEQLDGAWFEQGNRPETRAIACSTGIVRAMARLDRMA